MTSRRWWLLLGAIVGVEAGCMGVVWWLAQQNVTS